MTPLQKRLSDAAVQSVKDMERAINRACEAGVTMTIEINDAVFTVLPQKAVVEVEHFHDCTVFHGGPCVCAELGGYR